MNLPYYVTWTDQESALSIPITGSDKFSFHHHEKSYLDLTSISFQASFGIKNEFIANAIKKQVDHLPVASPKHHFDLKDLVTKRLLHKLNLDGKIFYTVSGAEAVENALKMSRRQSGKLKVLAKEESYHGATLGALSITGDWRNKHHKTIDDWTVRFPDHRADPDAHQLEKIIIKEGPETISALCIETMTGANGAYKPTATWYQKVQELCDKYSIHLILDEVICGFGRTGKDFGFHHYPSLKPDFICLSKAITGGFIPFGAVYTSKNISQYYDKNILACGLTNFAHPLGLAAMDAVLDIIEDINFYPHVNKIISLFENYKNKNDIRAKEIRVAGAMMAIDINHKKCLQDFLDAGLYLLVKDNSILVAPILSLPIEKLENALKLISEILNEK